MGSKRPTCTVLESFPNTKTRDCNLSSGGRISRDSSPRAAMTTRSDREEGRRDREREKAKDKSRFRDADHRERYHEPGPAPRMREAPRDKRRDERRNGRPLSTLETDFDKRMERDVKKGDTFPRMRRSRERDEGPEHGRQREKPKRTETDAWERDRERARHREMERVEWRKYEKYRQRHQVSNLAPRNHGRDPPPGGSRERRDRDGARRREISGGREARVPSPHSRRDGGSRPGREDWDRTRRKAGARGTRSEGDSDERETGRVRARERDELAYQHSRSEGDSKGGGARDRRRGTDRPGRGEEREERRRGASKVDERAAGDGGERTGQRREREYYRARGLREERQRQEREADPRWDDTTLEEAAPRAPPKSQSSGEWSSDMDNDPRRRRGGDGHGEGESGREGEREDGMSPARAERREQRRSRIDGKETAASQRRMWLEPQRGRNSKESSQEDDFGDRERPVREGERVESRRHEDAERREGTNEDHVGELDRLSASDGDIGEIWRRDVEGGSNSEDSEGGSETGWRPDKERMLSGEDGFVTVSSGGEDEREEFLDCQDYWEGGDTDDNSSNPREEHANEEELTERGREPKYVFCVIGQTLPPPESDRVSPSLAEEEEEEPRQNLLSESLGHSFDSVSRQPPFGPRLSPGRTDEHLTNSHQRFSLPDDPRMRPRQTEHPYAEIGPFNRDSETEKLLMKWRERSKAIAEREEVSSLPKNPYANVYPQVTFDQILPALEGLDVDLMSPEQKEAIRIRMSGAWSMSEEPKRHSQAPHLKWAKNVVREILGHSGEEITEDHGSREPAPTPLQEEESQPAAGRQETAEMSSHNSSEDELHSEPELELEEEESLEVEVEEEGPRGTRQGRQDMHADQFSAMHADTPAHYIHADTLVDVEGTKDPKTTMRNESEPWPDRTLDKLTADANTADPEQQNCEGEEETNRRGDMDMFLCVSNTLYKPSSCPILNCKSPLEFQTISGEVEDEVEWEEEEEGETGFPEGQGSTEVASETDESSVDGADPAARKPGGAALTSTSSFRDLGPEARLRRRGIRKTAERRNEALVEVEEEEGVAGDRRTRIFTTTDEDDRSKSWGEVELRNVLDTIGRRKRNSKFFNRAQLYQQYSEAAQNFEILRQSRSDVPSACEDSSASPAPSPPPARRPLPPLPPIPHPHSLSHTGSITSVKSLPLPEPPRSEGRPSSPRLSIALTESATLWRELPGVRNSGELEDITEDERRLQEVRFEVVTSEASYCRSLDIVVEHFVKCKQLGALLATQDRNWLFSRLADVRAISHSFLSKLEERLESDIMHFTVCDIIARHCQRFKMVYVPYLTNQSYQDATYQRLMNENPGFRRIVEKLERSPVCQRLPLRSFLVLPFQRITRIKLLVQNIVKRTTAGTAEATQAIKALRLLEKLIQESNDSISQMKSIESLVCLSAKVDFECRTLPLISQSRRLVREGPVTELIDFSLKDTERNIYMHLFNDYLLLSQQKEGGKFTVIDHAPVAELRAENCRVKLHSLQKNLFRLHTLQKSLLLRTDTQSDKLRWISALSRPHPEVDFSSAQDFPQMQCIRAVVAQQPDELSLEKADIILVHQQSSDHWVEGTRLSDGHRGWVPESHLELISNARVRQRNLSDALKLATAAV